MSNFAVQKLAPEVISVETAQNRITLLTVNAFIHDIYFNVIHSVIFNISNQAESGFNNTKIEQDTRISLFRHAITCYMLLSNNLSQRQLKESVRQNNAILKHFNFNGDKIAEFDKIAKEKVSRAIDGKLTHNGMPLHYWHGRDYIKQRVEPVFEKLVKTRALDPNDHTGRNTLRKHKGDLKKGTANSILKQAKTS